MHKANRSNEINWPKIALAKYLPNAIFGLCEFFPVQKSHKTRTLCIEINVNWDKMFLTAGFKIS